MAYLTNAELILITGTSLATNILDAIIAEADGDIKTRIRAAGLIPPDSDDDLTAASKKLSKAGIVIYDRMTGTQTKSMKVGDITIQDDPDAAILLCSTTAAMEDMQPYGVHVIVWDTNGSREADVAVTFTYNGMAKTLYTAEDGTTSFGTHNFGEVPDGAVISVSCKHGTTEEAVNYEYGATGITFNEPSQSAAIAAFTAMGFAVVIALGGGRYLLKRKKEDDE